MAKIKVTDIESGAAPEGYLLGVSGGHIDFVAPGAGGGGGGSGGSSDVGGRRYWQVRLLNSAGNDFISVAAIELASAPGGAALPISSVIASPVGNQDVNNLIDGNDGTFWYTIGQNVVTTILLDMGSVVAVREVRLKTRSDGFPTQTPIAIEVLAGEAPDSNGAYTGRLVASAVIPGAVGSSVFKVFPVPTSFT